ncbi:MAG: DUF2288 domain-containing protein [Geminocystis sp.]|nr:DUF2288 domain-containing protein [Geminocystis sp.]HIK36866.1 DUF2288 domain-containing protein [Geminocystis sp. M7585_C2015_104]MCS7148022.1 DUF2288 domain-containing protein [Geminocystis sp.]MCX8077765.1 DUF2288 domain-containing protein [Geminocystis sp.]MDW8116374.1 DUF2288 domain-containing protein [Geminocystis sp.]
MSDFKTQLQQQLAEVNWRDLLPHALRDGLILVSSRLDLVEVGCAIAEDNVNLVQSWINENLLAKPSASQLSQWNNNPTKKFKAIIVQPFVLIWQEEES